MSLVRFRVNAPKVVAEPIDGEVIIINLETGHYYSLVDVGADVWASLASAGTLHDAVAAVTSRYAGDPTVIADGVARLVHELEREALIVPAGGGDTPSARHPTPPPMPRLEPDSPEAERRRPFVESRLEKYIDMEKLLALDPVLEVDETGWPRPDRP